MYGLRCGVAYAHGDADGVGAAAEVLVAAEELQRLVLFLQRIGLRTKRKEWKKGEEEKRGEEKRREEKSGEEKRREEKRREERRREEMRREEKRKKKRREESKNIIFTQQ